MVHRKDYEDVIQSPVTRLEVYRRSLRPGTDLPILSTVCRLLTTLSPDNRVLDSN